MMMSDSIDNNVQHLSASSVVQSSTATVEIEEGRETLSSRFQSHERMDSTPSVRPRANALSQASSNASTSERQASREKDSVTPHSDQRSSHPSSVPSSSVSSSASDTSLPSQKDQFKKSRFNPFDRDIHVDEDHFSENENYFNPKGVGASPKSGSSTGSKSDPWSDLFSSSRGDSNQVTLTELGLAEDHFSHPQVRGHFGLSRAEELQLAIDNCKQMIKEATPQSERQKNLVKKLVELRLKLQEMKDEPMEVPPDVRVVLGHRLLVMSENQRCDMPCDQCRAGIWGLLQSWFKCEECGMCLHEKCALSVTRSCMKQRINESTNFLMTLPSHSWAKNKGKCRECQKRCYVSPQPDFPQAFKCEYDGYWYCEHCHWQDLMIIPARVVLNWDFKPRPVCRMSRQFLLLMENKPAIDLEKLNPVLFNFYPELRDIRDMRKQILKMRDLLVQCPIVRHQKLLVSVMTRSHFVDSADMYSMRDLQDVHNDVLLPEVTKIHAALAQHLKTDCDFCRGRGHQCEICNNGESLFAFESLASSCPTCKTVYHRHCLLSKGSRCSKCRNQAGSAGADVPTSEGLRENP